MKKTINLTEKKDTDLTKMLSESREELRVMRFSAAGARAKDTSAPKKIRAQVARILTELGNRAKNV
jgi:ribosomal protein L29